nr:MAG TPA: hypothetical protein [Bacteriophage sp.]
MYINGPRAQAGVELSFPLRRILMRCAAADVGRLVVPRQT